MSIKHKVTFEVIELEKRDDAPDVGNELSVFAQRDLYAIAHGRDIFLTQEKANAILDHWSEMLEEITELKAFKKMILSAVYEDRETWEETRQFCAGLIDEEALE